MRKVDPKLYHRDSRSEAPLQLTWEGTAGFTCKLGDRTLVLDPYVSRVSLLGHLKPMRPDEALVERVFPEAHEVIIGHAHYDHILDAPSICHRTGARLLGSPSACNVGRAAGLPERQLVETLGLEDIPCGDCNARGLPSRHGKVYFGRVTLPGDITEPPPWPPRFTHLRHGQVLNWLVEGQGLRVVHVDSADFITEHFAAVGEVDVLCLCAIGRRYRPNYTKEAIELLRPKVVVPCHWDYFFRPYEAEVRQLPGVDLEGFIEEVRAAGADCALLPMGGTLSYG